MKRKWREKLFERERERRALSRVFFLFFFSLRNYNLLIKRVMLKRIRGDFHHQQTPHYATFLDKKKKTDADLYTKSSRF